MPNINTKSQYAKFKWDDAEEPEIDRRINQCCPRGIKAQQQRHMPSRYNNLNVISKLVSTSY